MKGIFKFLIAVFLVNPAIAQQTISLYNGAIPNSIPTPNKETADARHIYINITEPTLGIFLPPKEIANGTAVIICPGGAYKSLWMKDEGWDVAANMNKLGVAAFVLKYRLPSDFTMQDKSIGPVQDAQRAIQIVRERAAEWNVDPNKIGIMGFSAGGHLASTVETHFNISYTENKKEISLRPDFAILVYPVISFSDSLTDFGSREALVGKDPSQKVIQLFSNEFQVTPQTPPTFLIQAEDDKMVSVKNSTVFFLALLKNHVAAGLHIFAEGGHGFPREPAYSNWFSYCASWLKENGWLKK